jgi:Ca-activated chloride channel homolog
MRSRVWLLLALPWLVGFELFQSPNRAIEAGNARMKAGKPEEALAEYDKAQKALPADPGVHFDRGAALSALGRHDEAAQEFLRATEAKTPLLKGSAFYNLGNSYFKTEKYADAVAAYRRALLLDPGDVRAKWNLELAQKKKREDDEKKKKENQDKQSKDDKNKDDKNQNKDDKNKQDQQAKNDQKKEEQKQQEDQNKKSEEQKKQEQQEQQAQKQDEQKKKAEEQKQQQEAKNEPAPKPEKAADMREIEAVLDSLERSPKNLEQERARLRAVRRAAPSKDW